MSYCNTVISVSQIETLLDFVEAHPQMVVVSRSKDERIVLDKLWKECAVVLNNVTPNCLQRSANNWRVYYNEFKCKTLKRAKDIKATEAEGMIPFRMKPKVLTPLQNRLCTILGRLNAPEKPIPPLREQVPSNTTSKSENGATPIGVTKKVLIPVQDRLCTIRRRLDVPEDQTPRRLESPSNASSQNENEENPLRSAMTERLERIRSKTEALQAQVAATNRLALAVEALTDLLQDPMRILLQRQDAVGIIDSSDSE